MPNHRKKLAVFYVNMLQQWHAPGADVFLVQSTEKPDSGDIPFWNDTEEGQAAVGDHLEPEQLQEFSAPLATVEDIFQVLLEHTEHRIETGTASSVQLVPY